VAVTIKLPIQFTQLQAWRRQYGYVELMLSVFVLILASQLIPEPGLADAIITTLGAVTLVSASMAISESTAALRKNLLVVVVGVAAWISTIAVDTHPFNSDPFKITLYICAFLFVVFIGVVILMDVFKSPVTGNRICGAICIYLLLGVAFALLHLTVFTFDPTAYSYTDPHGGSKILPDDNGASMSYFSFCTLSTVGYGDVMPVHKFARVFSWLEAIFGQLYLSILVARLVGLYIADEAANRTRA
jgi:hypothetical protein